MFKYYDFVMRKDAIVVSEKEVTPVFIRSLEVKSIDEIFEEFKRFLLKRREKWFRGYLTGITEIYLSFLIITIEIYPN